MPLHEGQIVTGRVLDFVGTGAKIALSPRLSANLSPRHLSWKRKYCQDAKDYFDIDNEVLLKILEIKNRDNKKPRIEVGFRETEPSPWAQALQFHPLQSKTRGVVCHHLPFGLIVELPTGFEAFVHESEVSWDHKPMRPVCPNCHAMIHKRRPPYSIEELRAVLSETVSVGKTVKKSP